jgi:CBS domain containing-hemolysin-like protein
MSQHEPSDRPQESWLDRVKQALGLAEPGSIRDDIEDALQEPSVASDFSPKERLILANVLGMHEIRVADVMTPRARIIAVNESATLAELLELFRSESHARLPVYGETPDDPKGMVHIRDFLAFIGEGDPPLAEAPRKLATLLKDAPLLRPVLFVPPSTPALDLLVRMQSKRVHMALVIDEYGETDGLVTMEDLVETIVGDIEDEHDTPKPNTLEQLDATRLLAAAEANLDEVRDIRRRGRQHRRFCHCIGRSRAAGGRDHRRPPWAELRDRRGGSAPHPPVDHS